MEPYRVPLQVYSYRPTGRRNVGRPKKRWKEVLEESWRRNGPVGPSLEVIDDDEKNAGI
jgi:hypothetical protein